MKSEIERRRHRRAVNMLGRLAMLGPLTFSLLFTAHAPSAHADTVIVFGAPGVGFGPGGNATAEAGPNNDPINTANATGGVGGHGPIPPLPRLPWLWWLRRQCRRDRHHQHSR